MKSLLLSFFVLLFIASANLLAQSTTYKMLDQSVMQIAGTSTIHDWTCDVQELNATVTFDAAAVAGKSDEAPVRAFTLTIPVEKIESGKGGMNKKIYGALKEKDHPNITFKLSTAELSEGKFSDPGFRLNATGMLAVAGISREVSFPVEGSLQDDGTYKFSGSYTINMRDYDVDPPSAVFGTIKSGEVVTVTFDLYLDETNIAKN